MISNNPGGVPTTITAEIEDRIMAILPKPIADYLKFEASTNISTGEIFRAWRAGSPVDQILYALRSHQRELTRKIYGASHPQASQF